MNEMMRVPPVGVVQVLDAQVATRLAAREGTRALAREGARKLAQERATLAVRAGARTAMKTAANPLLLVGDVVEFGIERTTGDKVVAKGTSAAVYVGVGAATGGPAGAAVGAVLWGVGQLVDALLA